MRDFFVSKGRTVDTLYFGGGTPSILPPDVFSRIVDSLRENFDLSKVEEFTVEVNPDDIADPDGDQLTDAFLAAGVNRISMGVQSFEEAHLKWMNRRHNAEQVYSAYKFLRDKGFDNISIDLIFGFAGLTAEQWKNTLSRAIDLSPEHISSYQMSIDSESTLAEMVASEKYKEPSDDVCASQYSLLQSMLAEAGYAQYEISSFCKPGYKSRHNSSYWQRESYLGLGAAAHSFDGDRIRRWNPSSVEAYCQGVPAENETLSDTDIYNERIMLGLRTVEGVPASLLTDEKNKLNLVYNFETERFAIPHEKFFICDSIIEDYIKTDD